MIADSSEEVEELRSAYNEIYSELEKTKHLLNLQNSVSSNYKKELEIVNTKMLQQKMEYEEKLREKAELLEMKANRIKVRVKNEQICTCRLFL